MLPGNNPARGLASAAPRVHGRLTNVFTCCFHPLVFGGEKDYRNDMSAAEILKHVKALPARERDKLLLAILALDEQTPARFKGRIKRVKWPDVEARTKRIFGDRVLPNLVLLEREEARF